MIFRLLKYDPLNEVFVVNRCACKFVLVQSNSIESSPFVSM